MMNNLVSQGQSVSEIARLLGRDRSGLMKTSSLMFRAQPKVAMTLYGAGLDEHE